LPEITRDEIIGGRRVVAFPADPPHATRHGDLSYVLRAYVAPGYVGAVDLALFRPGSLGPLVTSGCQGLHYGRAHFGVLSGARNPAGLQEPRTGQASGARQHVSVTLSVGLALRRAARDRAEKLSHS
jgi:hypothetical protein